MTALETIQHEFIDLFVLDVEEFPDAYKQTIRDQPSLWAMRTIAGFSEGEVRFVLENLKAERARVKASQ